MSPTLELLGAMIAAMRAYGPLTNLVPPTRIFDTVRRGAKFPYISIGPTDSIPDDPECIDGEEITVQFDIWTRPNEGDGDVGSPLVHKIAHAVRQALHDKDLVLTTNALVALRYVGTRTFLDPDGITHHAPITFTAVVEIH